LINKDCKLKFGTYVQIHAEHPNSLMACTTATITLRPTSNMQGSHYFLNIDSNRHVTANNWTILSMSTEVIETMHQLAAACRKHKGIVFTDSTDDNNSEIAGVDDTYGVNNVFTYNSSSNSYDIGNTAETGSESIPHNAGN